MTDSSTSEPFDFDAPEFFIASLLLFFSLFFLDFDMTALSSTTGAAAGSLAGSDADVKSAASGMEQGDYSRCSSKFFLSYGSGEYCS